MKEGEYLINNIINDIKSSLDHNLYFSALALSLVLPDACAKAEYPNEKRNAMRYKKWYKEYIGDSIYDSEDLPNITEEVAYNLRCCFLHEGNPNVESKTGIDKFELLFQEKDNSPDSEELEDGTTLINCKYWDVLGTDNSTNQKDYKINVRAFCEKICERVTDYYNDNKNKFSFDYSIVNWEDIKP